MESIIIFHGGILCLSLNNLLQNIGVDKRKKLQAEGQHTLDSVDDFLLASRSFDETVNKNTLWYFKIADRKMLAVITGPLPAR